MTQMLFREDSYLQEAEARVTAVNEGIELDATIFYPQGGGQPGDTGRLIWEGGETPIANTVKGEGDTIRLLPTEDATLPTQGAPIRQILNWERRYRHMRIHTALHLLSVVIPLGVTGGAITAEKGRLDFDMPEAPEDKAALEAELNALIAQDFPVTEEWITDAELAANPGLVKTMSVKPPQGAGRVRVIRIGEIDLQPCGGTHVARTSEIGPVTLGKIEKKGKQNRRVNLHLA